MNRCFFAIFPDSPSREQLAAEAQGIAVRLHGRPVGALNLHLTLVFIGRASAAQRARLEAIGDAIRAASFDLLLDEVGCFARAAVAWRAPATPPDGLLQLQAALAVACTEAGFAIESRPFRPHVTLVRDLRRDALALAAATRAALTVPASAGSGSTGSGSTRSDVLEATVLGASPEPAGWTAREFALVGSEAAPGGSVYTALRRWPLAGPVVHCGHGGCP